MKRIEHLLIFAFFMLPLGLCAQVSPPTLAAGLATVTGQKGEIDVALLSEIISKKQEEVRRELLQRQILSRMEANSFALTNYVYSSFYALLSLKEKHAIEKEMLTQISILSLQVGLAETILQLSYQSDQSVVKPSEALRESLRIFIREKYKVRDPARLEAVLQTFERLARNDDFILLLQLEELINEAVNRNGIKSSLSMNKSRHDLQVRSISKEEFQEIKELYAEGEELPTFTAIFLDCVYEACRTNIKLEQMGFVSIHPNLKAIYFEENKYLQYSGLQKDLMKLVKGSMSLLVDNYVLFSDFVTDPGLSISDIRDVLATSALSNSELNNKLDSASLWVEEVASKMDKLVSTGVVNADQIESLATQLNVVQNGLMEFNIRNGSDMNHINSNDYLFFDDYIDPFIHNLVAMGVMGQEHSRLSIDVKKDIYRRLVDSLCTTLSNQADLSGVLNIHIDQYAHLIRLIISLNQLDNVKSYEHLFNSLSQVGVRAVIDRETRFVKDLIYSLEAFTTINLEENRLSVDVEALLLQIISLYENTVDNDLQLYFGIGLNQTLDIHYRDEDKAVLDKDSTTLTSLGYASEKIGIKYKVVNFKRRQAEQRAMGYYNKGFKLERVHGNTSPLISDVYVYAYGSGLLYNVANLTTEGSAFDEAMIGFGVGLAFFNSLDFAIWRSSPLSSDYSLGENLGRAFYGISFDIKLTEYLSALGEKKRLAKLNNP